MMNSIANIVGAGVRTMSSREIAELTEKNHADVLRDIRNMLEQLGFTASSFAGSYKDSTGRTLPTFNLPEDLTITLVSGYSVQMRHRIVKRWQELEAKAAQPGPAPAMVPSAHPPEVVSVMFAEAVNRALNLTGSAALGTIRRAAEIAAPHLLPALPVYAIDAPAGESSAIGSEPTCSLTEMLREHDIKMSARAANLKLQAAGLIEQVSRDSSGGGKKQFWSITDKGSRLGKNVTSPSHPRETQPHWFSSKAASIIETLRGGAV